jgi:hypothetical protein
VVRKTGLENQSSIIFANLEFIEPKVRHFSFLDDFLLLRYNTSDAWWEEP